MTTSIAETGGTDNPAITADLIDDPLLFACILDGKGGGEIADWKQACDWRQRDHPTQFLWLHLDKDAKGLAKALETHLHVSKKFVELLTTDSVEPALEIQQGMLGLALRVITDSKQVQWQDMYSLRMWSDGRRFVTMGHDPIVAPRQVLADIRDRNGPVDAGAMLTTLANYLSSETAGVIAHINAKIDRLQGIVHAHGHYRRFQKLTTIRHNCLALERHIGPQHTILERIVRQGPAWIGKEDLDALRDTISWLERFVTDLGVSESSAAVLLEELMGRVTFNANRTSYLLSLVAGVFLPLTFLTGLLGINVNGIPGAKSPIAFWVVVGVCCSIVAVQIHLFRKWKWF